MEEMSSPLPSWFANIDGGNSTIVYPSCVKDSPALRDIDASIMPLLMLGRVKGCSGLFACRER
jgi:hypothetical protein